MIAPQLYLTENWFTRRLRGLFKGSPQVPELARNHGGFSDFDQNRPLAEYDFVVLDTELTGLNPHRDEIVSVGAVRIRDLRIEPGETFFTMVEPKVPLPKASTLIHHITPSQVRGRPRLRAVLPRLVEYLNGSLVVGHWVGLDMSFLNRASRRILGGSLMNPCLDTMRLAMVYQEELWENNASRVATRVSYSLVDLCKDWGLPQFPAHHALYDAMQTAYLFLYLVKKLRQGGIETLKDLYMAGRGWRWYL